MTIYTNEIYHCLKEMLDTIGEEARLVLEATPPELAGDIIERGVMVTGGGALDPMESIVCFLKTTSSSDGVQKTRFKVWRLEQESIKPH